jgi:hypothetical protein
MSAFEFVCCRLRAAPDKLEVCVFEGKRRQNSGPMVPRSSALVTPQGWLGDIRSAELIEWSRRHPCTWVIQLVDQSAEILFDG